MTSRAKAPLRSLTRRQAAATPAAACVSYLLSTAQGLAAHPALQQEPPRQHFSGPHGHKDLNCEQKPEGEEGPPPCSAEEKINLQEARATYSAVAAELCHRALMVCPALLSHLPPQRTLHSFVGRPSSLLPYTIISAQVSAKNSLPLPKGFVGTLCQACSLPLGPNTTESQSVSALSRTQARRQRRKLAASCAARQRSAGSSASTFKNPPIIPLMSSLQEIQFPLLAPVSLPTLFCSPRRNTCTLERVCLLCGHTNRLFFYTEDAAKKVNIPTATRSLPALPTASCAHKFTCLVVFSLFDLHHRLTSRPLSGLSLILLSLPAGRRRQP